MVSDRRVLSTSWVAEAWAELHDRSQTTIINTFGRVGLSLNPGGLEDAEILIKGVEALEIGDYERQHSGTQSAEAR